MLKQLPPQLDIPGRFLKRMRVIALTHNHIVQVCPTAVEIDNDFGKQQSIPQHSIISREAPGRSLVIKERSINLWGIADRLCVQAAV